MIDKLFGEVKDYSSMLQRLSIWSFITSLVVIETVSSSVSWVNKVTHIFSIPLRSLGFELPLVAGVIALIAAASSQLLPLHDVLSDIFGVRRRFDHNVILRPLAIGSHAVGGQSLEHKLRTQRSFLMYNTFYKYASSTAPTPVVDRHLIQMALTSWSWYWIGLECIFFIGIGSVILFFDKEFAIGFLLLTVGALIRCLMALAYIRCEKYAAHEIQDILADPARTADVRGVFDAL